MLGEQTISAAAASSARSHSRIHSRNLSVFFPRPTPNQDDKSTPNAQAPQPHAATGDAGPSDLIPPISARGPDDRTVTRPAQRRGHHHRHSVSLAISPSEIPRVPPILARDGTGTPPQEVGSYASGQGGSLSQQGRPVPPLALVLSIAQIAVGAYLWIKGQRLESLSTTGLGYVVVFDGIAVVLAARLGVSGGSAREGTTRGLGLGGGDALGSLRRPYGYLPFPFGVFPADLASADPHPRDLQRRTTPRSLPFCPVHLSPLLRHLHQQGVGRARSAPVGCARRCRRARPRTWCYGHCRRRGPRRRSCGSRVRADDRPGSAQ